MGINIHGENHSRHSNRDTQTNYHKHANLALRQTTKEAVFFPSERQNHPLKIIKCRVGRRGEETKYARTDAL